MGEAMEALTEAYRDVAAVVESVSEQEACWGVRCRSSGTT
jgi:hypothetical protein